MNYFSSACCDGSTKKDKRCSNAAAAAAQELCGLMGAAIQDYQRGPGITLAGKFDLINVGMACKTLLVLSAYFRNAKSCG